LDGKRGEEKVDRLISAVKGECSHLLILDEKEVDGWID